MKKECENGSVDGVCLKVFGALAASVTHEIKNTLSIINENAGLLEDLCAMADEETGIPVEHVDAASKTVVKQVGRSNTVLKNLNRFAHSGDKVPGQADMQDILSFVVALTSRFAAMKKIAVSTVCPSGVEIRTNLLVLESLLFLTLCRIYAACSEGSVLIIQGESDGKQRATVRFMLEGDSVLDCEHYPGREEQVLAADIGASCKSQGGEIIIELAAYTQQIVR